jgi:hypothetical protein
MIGGFVTKPALDLQKITQSPRDILPRPQFIKVRKDARRYRGSIMRDAAIAMRHTVIVVGSLCFALLAGSARAETADAIPNDDTVQSAPAETAAACLPWRAAVLSAKAADSHNALVNVMEGAEASDFLSFANALPPASHVDGNRVAIVFAPESDQFIFVVGQQNCATAIMQVPRAAIEQLTGPSV